MSDVSKIKDGTVVRVTVEGVVNGNGVSVHERCFLYDNVLRVAEIEVVASPIGIGEFFTDGTRPGGFIGLVISETSYSMIKSGSLEGRIASYDTTKLHKQGYVALTHDEVKKYLAPTTNAKTTTNVDW